MLWGLCAMRHGGALHDSALCVALTPVSILFAPAYASALLIAAMSFTLRWAYECAVICLSACWKLPAMLDKSERLSQELPT